MTTHDLLGFGQSGRFVEVERHFGARSVLRGSLFSGRSPLSLHDRELGRAKVTRSNLGPLVVGAVGSTGHDVTVREAGALTLLIPVRGKVLTEIGGETRSAEPGSALLLPRGTRKTRVEGRNGASFAANVLTLPPDVLGVERHIDHGSGIVLNAAVSHDVAHLMQTIRFLIDLLEADAKLFDRPGVVQSWSTLVAGVLDQTVESLLGDGRSGDAIASPEARAYVGRAEEFMRSTLAGIVTTDDIAREVGVSRRTLETSFRKIRGESPAKVLLAMRLHAARRLLLSADGPPSVTEVCLDCGIGHHGRFSAAYQAAFGEPPSVTLRRR
jgi:AraC-like DNA-binding protein